MMVAQRRGWLRRRMRKSEGAYWLTRMVTMAAPVRKRARICGSCRRRAAVFQSWRRSKVVRDSTFGMNWESDRIDIRAAGELASCCGVNLAVAGLGCVD